MIGKGYWRTWRKNDDTIKIVMMTPSWVKARLAAAAYFGVTINDIGLSYAERETVKSDEIVFDPDEAIQIAGKRYR